MRIFSIPLPPLVAIAKKKAIIFKESLLLLLIYLFIKFRTCKIKKILENTA